MESSKMLARYSLEALNMMGFKRYECTLSFTRKDELVLYGGEISLLRTAEDASLILTGISEGRKGSVTINRTDRPAIDEAAARVMEMAESSEIDSANDVSPTQPPGKFQRGPAAADLNRMHDRMREYISYSQESYPSLILRQAVLQFFSECKYYMNSNGVDLRSRRGYYTFSPLFASKKGSCTSSFNYPRVVSDSLDKSLHRYGNLDTLMLQSTQQVHSRGFQEKFLGDVIITPDCLQYFLYMISQYLRDVPLATGTSIFRNSLNALISAPSLTLSSMPLSAEIATGYFITKDGFIAENNVVINEGILKTFLLSLYGARKTGNSRALSDGNAFVVEAGQDSLERMISSVDRGILLCRFSGSRPSESGNFSGVVKNSYYIEGGEIRYPVKEVMLSGNLKDLLLNIRSISAERVNSGYSVLPWIGISDLSIFGK